MDLKHFLNKTFVGFALKNIVAAVVLVIVVVAATLLILRGYTHHGEKAIVPDLRGQYEAEAEVALAPLHLTCEVIDSTFDRRKPLGVIIEQTPPAGTAIKYGRPVYLIINSRAHRQIPVPEVRDVSYRQAEASLKAIGFVVGKVIYEPSEYKDLVLDLRHGGNSVEPGTRLEEGTELTLVIGRGSGESVVTVPDLTGLSLEQARRMALQASLVVGGVDYDTPTVDETVFYVYAQDPAAGQVVTEGQRINLRLSATPGKSRQDQRTDYEEEQFF